MAVNAFGWGDSERGGLRTVPFVQFLSLRDKPSMMPHHTSIFLHIPRPAKPLAPVVMDGEDKT